MKNVLATILSVCFLFVSPLLVIAEEKPILSDVQQKVVDEFARLDAAMKRTARAVGVSGLTGNSARSSLAELCGEFAFAVNCAAVDIKEKMVTMEPSHYRRFEGSDISKQEHIKRMMKNRKPILSSVFRAVEGFDAADIEYPVFTPQGKHIGSVSLLFKPEVFFTRILTHLIKGIPVNVWVMEKKGRIIYDIDPSQIGLNLFSSSIYQPYPQLRKLGRSISSKKEGTGSYRFKVFGEGRVGIKRANWKTTSLYGTEWRVVGVHIEGDKSGRRSSHFPAAPKPEEKLESLATEGRFVKALSRGDKNAVMKLFNEFYGATMGIYSIQWVDENAINRFGYPADNSLTGYDYRRHENSRKDDDVLEILKSRKKSRMETLLFEGKSGVFNFVPVLDGDRYLGMIYIIRLK